MVKHHLASRKATESYLLQLSLFSIVLWWFTQWGCGSLKPTKYLPLFFHHHLLGSGLVFLAYCSNTVEREKTHNTEFTLNSNDIMNMRWTSISKKQTSKPSTHLAWKEQILTGF